MKGVAVTWPNWNAVLGLRYTTSQIDGVDKARFIARGIPTNGFSNTSIVRVILMVEVFGVIQVSLLNMDTKLSKICKNKNKKQKQKSAIDFFLRLWRKIARFDFISFFSCIVSFVRTVVVYGCSYLRHDDVFIFSIRYPLNWQIVSLTGLSSKYGMHISKSIFPSNNVE